MSDKPLKWSLAFCWFWGLSMSYWGLYAQNGSKILPKIPPPDSALLKQYNSLASVYLNAEKPDSMYLIVQRGLALADKSNNENYKGIFLFQMTRYFKEKYQSDSGLIYSRKAIVLLQRYKDWKRISRLMVLRGTFYLDKNDQISTIKELEAMQRFNEKYNEHSYTGYAYNLLATTFGRLKDTLNEKKYILKQLDFAEKNNSDLLRLAAFELLGSFLVRQKQFRIAHIYYTKSYALAKSQKNEEAQVELLCSIGANLLSMKAYNKSFEALRLAEKIAFKHIQIPGWNTNLSTTYAHISSLFLATDKPKEALNYATRSFALVENEPLRYDYLIRALKNQAAAQKALGRYKEALSTYERLQAVTQSIDVNKDREIAKDIEAKYQLEKSDREKELFEKSLRIKELELQNQQKKARILWILLGVFAVSLGGGYWFYRKNQVYNDQISRKNQQLEILNETKDKLFGIIGHDLRAPVVDMINALTLLEYIPVNAKQLPLQSGLLRKNAISLQTILNNLLYWAFSQRQLLRANPRFISLKNNIEEALDFLDGIMQEKSLRAEWFINLSDAVYADENHVKIILYNVLHNAVKFSPYNSTVQIAITAETSCIILRLTNKGNGFEWEDAGQEPGPAVSATGTFGEKGTGLGLLVCAELMKLNKGTIRAYPASIEATTLELIFPRT